MDSFEMTDIDGDALTFITRDGSTWITCTSGADEVTVGPFPAHLLRRALASEVQQNEQFTTTFLSSSAPSSGAGDTTQEVPAAPVGAPGQVGAAQVGATHVGTQERVGVPALRLLDPVRGNADALPGWPAPLASREG